MHSKFNVCLFRISATMASWKIPGAIFTCGLRYPELN